MTKANFGFRLNKLSRGLGTMKMESGKFAGNIDVIHFRAEGGASRLIEIKSADPVLVASELEQARFYNSIQFVLAETPVNAMAYLELYELFHLQQDFELVFSIFFSDYYFTFKSHWVTLRDRPKVNHGLVDVYTSIGLGGSSITRQVFKKTNSVIEEW